MSLGWLGVGVITIIFPPPVGPTAGNDSSVYSPSLGLLVVVLVCAVQVGFGIGWGAVPWVFPAEIFPMRIKEKAMATSVFSQYASNFMLLQLFPIVTAVIGTGGSCIWFSCNMALAGWCVHRWVPETAGVKLEDMESLFAARPGATDVGKQRGRTSDWAALRSSESDGGTVAGEQALPARP